MPQRFVVESSAAQDLDLRIGSRQRVRRLFRLRLGRIRDLVEIEIAQRACQWDHLRILATQSEAI